MKDVVVYNVLLTRYVGFLSEPPSPPPSRLCVLLCDQRPESVAAVVRPLLAVWHGEEDAGGDCPARSSSSSVPGPRPPPAGGAVHAACRQLQPHRVHVGDRLLHWLLGLNRRR